MVLLLHLRFSLGSIDDLLDKWIDRQMGLLVEQFGQVPLVSPLVVVSKCHSFGDALVVGVMEIVGRVKAKTCYVKAFDRKTEQIDDGDHTGVGKADVGTQSAFYQGRDGPKAQGTLVCSAEAMVAMSVLCLIGRMATDQPLESFLFHF